MFLWQGRSYVRKAAEAYFTVLIELLWSKRRIMEMYLSVAEMGDCTFGVEAASQRYFHKSARNLSAPEAALLAGVLPNPLRFRASQPGPAGAGQAAARCCATCGRWAAPLTWRSCWNGKRFEFLILVPGWKRSYTCLCVSKVKNFIY
ncbi:MAG: transglycosylase domain-containing protein [Hymenobacter sp.]